MGKVISFELKKLVSRIGIYILVVLLAGAVAVSVFAYNPTTSPNTNYELAGKTVSSMYNSFINDGIKDEYTGLVANISANAETYVTSSSNYSVFNNKQAITDIFNQLDTYCLTYAEIAGTDDYDILLIDINNGLETLRSTIDNALKYSKNKTGYYMLTSTSNYTKLFSTISDISMNFDTPVSHRFAGEKYVNEYRTTLINCLNKLVYPTLNNTAKKYTDSGQYYSIISMRMEEIEYKMEQLNKKVVADPSLDTSNKLKQELNTLFDRYVNCALIFNQSYSTSMCVDALYCVKGKTTRANLVGYNDISLYEQEELSVIYKYYIEHHCNSNDFANSLSITHTSNNKINAYDFTFFVMSLFSVVVIIYSIYLSARTISGEINNNTMRFTALRPIKRGTIFFGKFLAILIMSSIILLFGAITSFIVGGIMFGFETANILMIINSAHVVIAHPIAVLVLFVLSLILLVAFYSAITIMLSAFIKSDILVAIIGVVLYIVNLILPLFFGAGSWLRFYPGVNVNLFAYFSSNRLTGDNMLGKIFNNVVYHGMNLWISLVYIIGITALVLVIGKTIFKKRDL